MMNCIFVLDQIINIFEDKKTYKFNVDKKITLIKLLLYGITHLALDEHEP